MFIIQLDESARIVKVEIKFIPNAMPSITHLAHCLPISDLLKKLEQEIKERFVYKVSEGDLDLYCYTRRCIYNNSWNAVNLVARGLIIDRSIPRIIATPFPKFFNYGENNISIPDCPFTVTNKLDGSLIIVYYYQGWKTATKGDFTSDVALKAQVLLKSLNTNSLEKGFTYLFEFTSPENQIVIQYKTEQLTLLSAYTDEGLELDYDELIPFAKNLGTSVVEQTFYPDFSTLLEAAKKLSVDYEGFVIRFENGLRLKLKGKAYRQVHKLISEITPIN